MERDNEYIVKAKEDGLFEKVLEGLKEEKEVNAVYLQRRYSISFPMAKAIMEELVRIKAIKKDPEEFENRSYLYAPMGSMKIYLIDINPWIIEAWENEFFSYKNVKVIQAFFSSFMGKHQEVDVVVAPGNSFGFMDGGFDGAIKDYFSPTIEKKVQDAIKENCFGEAGVGTALSVPIDDKRALLYVPSMRTIGDIQDEMVIYQCMRVALIEAYKLKAKAVVIPAFGGASGNIEPERIARLMKQAYCQIDAFLRGDDSLD